MRKNRYTHKLEKLLSIAGDKPELLEDRKFLDLYIKISRRLHDLKGNWTRQYAHYVNRLLVKRYGSISNGSPITDDELKSLNRLIWQEGGMDKQRLRNYVETVEELESKGHSFHTHSTVAQQYRKWFLS